MRTNLPVTQLEFEVPSDRNLVSVTDLKGRITYCNSAFISASGYTREELLGQSHNVVRHPDMPEEAYRDLWQTIQSDRPWAGCVKNRRKNGDHYWVHANVTPIRDGERIVGYLSVRTSPERRQVDAASALYERIRAQGDMSSPAIGLHHGRVVAKGFFGRSARLPVMAIDKLGGLDFYFAFLAAGAAVAAAALLLPAWAGALCALLAITTACGWANWLQQSRLHSVVRDAMCLAAADLSHEPQVRSRGAVGRLQFALRQISVNLRSVIGDVYGEIGNLRASAREIADGNQDLSQRTESQSSSLEQTAASMEQITGTVGQSASSAIEGARIGVETTVAAHRSHDAVLSAAKAMDAIQDSSRRIQEIVQVIEGVAFQTNILALNAAVEAARAGEQGRGFAVVAAEVRTLSQRTADAAREIKRLIGETTERIAHGHTQTLDARDRMHASMEAVEKVNQLLSEISTSAKEQQSGITQVNDAVSHMDSMTQQNAAMVEQLAASARALDEQILSITNSMRVFRMNAGEPSLAEIDAVGLRRQAKHALATT